MEKVKIPKSNSTIRFKAELSKSNSHATIQLPKSASAKLSSPASTMVEGIINNFPFRAPIESSGGALQIKISDSIQKAAKANFGDTVNIEITRVGEEPETRVPADLKKALNENSKAYEAWKKITPMARRDWVLSICLVKQQKTREIRLEKTCDMLASGKGRICCFPGINWITKDHVSKDETWLPLASPKKKNER